MGSLSAAAPLGAARACPLPESWSLCLHTSSTGCSPPFRPSLSLAGPFGHPRLTSADGQNSLCTALPAFACRVPPSTASGSCLLTLLPGPQDQCPRCPGRLVSCWETILMSPESSLHVLRSWKMVPTPIVSPRKPASCFSGFPVPHRLGMQNIRAREGSKDPTRPSRCSQSGEAKRWASDPQATPQ